MPTMTTRYVQETDPLIASHRRVINDGHSTRWYALVIVSFVLVSVALFNNRTHLNPASLRAADLTNLGSNESNKKSTRRYRATQFISFTINTLGGIASMGECEGRPTDPDYEGKEICYLGNTKNLTEDIEHRFRIVKEVLDIIQNDKNRDDPEIDHSADVMKIFMLPEFFLRGPFGAYSIATLYDDQKIMLQLSDAVFDLVKDDEFEDYLFVFGTVVFTRSPNDPRKPWEAQLPANEVLYWNFAPMMRGGRKAQRYLITKKYISTADFLDRTTLPNPAQTDISQYSVPSERMQKLLTTRDTILVEDNIISLDGINIGIEICLDHRIGVLWDRIQSTGEPLVDVQLITSAGMSIERGPNPLKPGGVVYLSDGEASSGACMRTDTGPFDPTTVCRSPGPGGIKHVPKLSAKPSEFILLSGCIDFLRQTDLLKGYYSIYQTQGCAYTLKLYGIDVMDEYKYYPPSIEIYPVVDLPFNEFSK